jgi:hypothetical protein
MNFKISKIKSAEILEKGYRGPREQGSVFYDSALLSSSRRQGTQNSPWAAAKQTDGAS